MPYKDRTFEIDFDFIDHQLLIKCNDGAKEAIAPVPLSVADSIEKLCKAGNRNLGENLARAGRSGRPDSLSRIARMPL